MSVDELVEALKARGITFEVKDNDHIRDGFDMCPLCSGAYHLLGRAYSNFDWARAAADLGISPGDAARVAISADETRMYTKYRSLLLTLVPIREERT